MAFLCNDCINNKDEFLFSLTSKGPCENCHYTDICVDTKSDIDPHWQENVARTLAAVEARNNARVAQSYTEGE